MALTCGQVQYSSIFRAEGLNIYNWRASEARETLSGVYKFVLVRYIYIYIYIRECGSTLYLGLATPVLELPVTLTPGVASSGCSSSDGLPLIEPELLLLWVSCID